MKCNGFTKTNIVRHNRLLGRQMTHHFLQTLVIRRVGRFFGHYRILINKKAVTRINLNLKKMGIVFLFFPISIFGSCSFTKFESLFWIKCQISRKMILVWSPDARGRARGETLAARVARVKY